MGHNGQRIVTATTVIGVGTILALAGLVQAQTTCVAPTNCLTNPGFETVNPFNASEPLGWHNLSNVTEVRRRTLTDGLLPPAVVRTGVASIMVATPGNSDFRGMTTDTVNFFQAGFPFFDVAYNYADAKDVVFSGYYFIPTNSPVVGDFGGVKMNVKGLNQDYATLDPWGGQGPTFQGDTGGLWVLYEKTWTAADIITQVQNNSDLGIIPFPPTPPNRVKFTIGRFAFDAPASSGVIFWDDVKLELVDAVPACPACPADYNQDGGVTGDDIAAFFADFEAGSGCADTNVDGGITGDDIAAFFSAFESGGC